MDDKLIYIYNIMKDIKGKTPILLLEEASIIFKRIYKGKIFKIENTEDAKELISMYSNIDYNKPLVVEDISLLYRDSIMLKMIEEINIPLIFLASLDNLSNPFYSRMKTVIKFPNDEDTECSFMSVRDAQSSITQDELSGYQLDKFIAENCPQLSIIYKNIKYRKNKDRLIQIIGGLYDKHSKS